MTLVRSLLFAGFVGLLVWGVAQNLALGSARTQLDQTLLLTERAVEAEVERLRSLPLVASEDVRVRRALAGTGALQDANTYLETVALHAQAGDLFLINAGGDTIAASNWNRPGSFVGQNYAFRPYFQQAMENGQGQFYGIGVTTGVPGYFLATRIDVDGAAGVIVVKLDLRPLQDIWRTAGANVALADEHGVVFLTARPDWEYRALTRLSPDVLAELSATRAYEGAALATTEPLLAQLPRQSDAVGEGWIGRIATMPSTGWQVIAARATSGLRLLSLGAGGLAAILTLAMMATYKAWDQRRQIIALRLSQSEKLESMVLARTADLAREVEARTQVEVDLRATQEALVHTEKMAALGRMSAAIVHEISQPLAAMEATLSAAELGLDKSDTVTTNRLAKARGLIRRMQRTTKHLRSFARKDVAERSLVDLGAPVASALELVAPRARDIGVVPVFHTPDGKVEVMAGAVRIEQVVANLLLNALDAVADVPDATITVTLTAEDGQAWLCVEDTGRGIAETDLPNVAEPFFSTKLSGESLGLGLAICKAILSDFHGSLAIRSAPGHGTKVTVSLPLASVQGAQAA
ncbi:ATP-binding protein [uncultured Maritimibacter sp.]|jgi:two-component system C4-dicarboxylate transport sensor histidine kinase DctB|uniref:sensor histidine kinase n=1 Tax=uncultured Maritimibacter sp. TaxID=991866 RepID=UPI000AD38D0E|nr:ATP-binding protein [uncultured Maritimibacter sp.]